jgi:hypothetical protein
MTTSLEIHNWATRNSIPALALEELMWMFGAEPVPPHTIPGTKSEAAIQNEIRVDVSKSGGRAWRNNVGVLMNEINVPVRYGLANESKQMNQSIKSSDLIGLRPVTITQEHVGTIIGQFCAWEVKKQDWKYTGNKHEVAQLKFQQIVTNLGGHAQFVNSVDNLR